MNALLDKIKKNSTIKETAILSESEIYNDNDNIPTEYPILNLAFSGDLHRGFKSGLNIFAGESKHFKSGFTLACVSAYFLKYPDAVCLFYDSEFGAPASYFASFGIDATKIIHTPITDIEELKFDIVNQIENITRKDRVIIIIDSIGNLASKKEVDDAKDKKSVADMSRAKSLASFFRIITPKITMKDVPLIAINHVYKTMDLFPKTVTTGGQKAVYSPNSIFIIGRQQEKDGKETTGYNFTLNVEKSREVREKSKFDFTISFEKGIDKYSGLLDLALESGHVTKPSMGWYSKVDIKTGEIADKKIREKETHTKEFWNDILDCEKFKTFVKNKFSLNCILNQEE